MSSRVTTSRSISRSQNGIRCPKAASSAAFSPDGTQIATADASGTVRVWDTATGAGLAALRGYEGELIGAVFSADGALIVAASFDGTVGVWDATTGAELAVLRGHERVIDMAAFSPDGARIVTVSDDGTARVWDATKMGPTR